MKKISKVNVEKAIERRKAIYNDVAANLDTIEKIHISMGNSKMGPIPSFSVLPFLTCTNCNHCSKYCYAAKGNFNFPRNVNALAENTVLVEKNVKFVENEINRFLNCSTIIYKYFRWNVAGDIAGKVEKNYFDMIIRVAKKNTFTRFLLFTKNYKLINDFLKRGNKIPGNLSVVFSQWDNFTFDNPYNLPIAIVKIDENTVIPGNAFHCSGDCANCLNCWNAKTGDIRYFDLH